MTASGGTANPTSWYKAVRSAKSTKYFAISIRRICNRKSGSLTQARNVSSISAATARRRSSVGRPFSSSGVQQPSLRATFGHYRPVSEKAKDEFSRERKNFIFELALFGQLRKNQKQQRFVRRDAPFTINAQIRDNCQPFLAVP